MKGNNVKNQLFTAYCIIFFSILLYTIPIVIIGCLLYYTEANKLRALLTNIPLIFYSGVALYLLINHSSIHLRYLLLLPFSMLIYSVLLALISQLISIRSSGLYRLNALEPLMLSAIAFISFIITVPSLLLLSNNSINELYSSNE